MKTMKKAKPTAIRPRQRKAAAARVSSFVDFMDLFCGGEIPNEFLKRNEEGCLFVRKLRRINFSKI